MTSKITPTQFSFMTACYIQGSLLYTMYYFQCAGHNAWIGLIIAALAFLLCLWLYSALYKKVALYKESHPKEDTSCTLIAANRIGAGRVWGTMLCVVFMLYFAYLCAFNVREASQFIGANMMMPMPIPIAIFLLTFLCAAAARRGIRFFTATGAVLCIGISILTVLLCLLLIGQMRFDFILPIEMTETVSVLRAAVVAFTMPFGELVVLLMLAGRTELKPSGRSSFFRSSFRGFIFGVIFLVVILLRDVFVLGPLTGALSYPSYEVIRFVELGSAIARIESIFDLPLLFLLFYKIALLLWCVSLLFARIINIRRSGYIVYSAALVIAVGAMFFAPSNISLINWSIRLFPYIFAVPQVLLPCVVVLLMLRKKDKCSILEGRG